MSDTTTTQMRDEQHECHASATKTTRVQHECYRNDTNATRVPHERHEYDTSATQVKNFDFDNNTSENIFWHPYISYVANEKLQREEQFHSTNYLL